MLLGAPHHIEISRGINAHFIDQMFERDELTGAGRHRDLFAATHQGRELHQYDIKLVIVEVQRLEGRPHARDITVMIGAPDVHHAIKTAHEFFAVIGDIRREIGLHTVVTHHHTIFLIAIIGGAKPLCAGGFVDEACFDQFSNGGVDGAVTIERGLGIPAIEFHAKRAQALQAFANHRRVAKPVEHHIGALCRQRRCDGKSYPVQRSGDQCTPAFEHFYPLPCAACIAPMVTART